MFQAVCKAFTYVNELNLLINFSEKEEVSCGRQMELKVVPTLISLGVIDGVTFPNVPHATRHAARGQGEVYDAHSLIKSRKLSGQRRLVCTNRVRPAPIPFSLSKVAHMGPYPNPAVLTTSPASNPLLAEFFFGGFIHRLFNKSRASLREATHTCRTPLQAVLDVFWPRSPLLRSFVCSISVAFMQTC